MGSGDKKKINGIFSSGMIIILSSALVLTAAGFLFTGGLCRLFGAAKNPVIYFNLNKYLKGWFTGIPGYILFFALSPLVNLDGNKKCVTAATFIQSGINVIGDILAISVFNAGTFGIGVSTGLAYNISACILLLNFVRKKSVFRFFAERPDFTAVFKGVHIGMPVITKQVCKILSPLLTNRIILFIGGSAAMSAFSVKSSILGFCVIICNGVAESVGLMAQVLYNEKDAVSLKQLVKDGFKLHLSLDITLSVLLFIFSGRIAALYIPTEMAEWRYASQIIRFLAISLILNGCNVIIIRYLQAARKMAAVHTLTLFHRMVSVTAFTLILGKSFGIIGLFAAVPAGEAAVLVGYLLIVLLKNRKRDFWSSILMIPDNFGYNSENSFSVSITTVEEAVAVSEHIEAFCLRHQVDSRKSYYSAICMEELAANIVERGFKSDNKKHHCDIRVMIDPDEVVLRLRDDCSYYNIRERYDALSKDDVDAGLWLRLVFAIAKDVNYINIFNTNTLIIKM